MKTKKSSKRKKLKLLFFLMMLLIGVSVSYQKLESSKLRITNKDFVNLITDETFSYEEPTLLESMIEKWIQNQNPIQKLNLDYQKYLKENPKIEEKIEKNDPIVYLYNSHQTEEYAPSTYAEFSVYPTVIMNNYIIEDYFNKNGLLTITEEKSIKEILNQNKWNYASSYKASRLLMEEKKTIYPSLEYFIDIHRDSLEKDKTSITIDNKEYAKVLFIVGLENPNYEENLAFTEKIDQKLREYYPNLSKGIYQKSGVGVNGVYNQDFSSHTILIEIGGYQNTTTEVLNSSLAFARCFLEVIHE